VTGHLYVWKVFANPSRIKLPRVPEE
jgi:hypothetical protein